MNLFFLVLTIKQSVFSLVQLAQLAKNFGLCLAFELAEAQYLQEKLIHLYWTVAVQFAVLVHKRDYLTHDLRSSGDQSMLTLTQQSMVS